MKWEKNLWVVESVADLYRFHRIWVRPGPNETKFLDAVVFLHDKAQKKVLWCRDEFIPQSARGATVLIVVNEPGHEPYLIGIRG